MKLCCCCATGAIGGRIAVSSFGMERGTLLSTGIGPTAGTAAAPFTTVGTAAAPLIMGGAFKPGKIRPSALGGPC